MTRAVYLSAAEMAAEEMRALILRGELRPGDRISADDVARELGISRTPVRDALQILRTEGLVDIQARVGAFVRRITHREISEVYALKMAIEPLAAAWAAELSDASQRERLVAEMVGLEQAALDGDADAAVLRVDAIHDLIFEMTQSQVMVDVYRVFRGRVRVLRQMNLMQPGRLAVSADQHRRVVDAITARDCARARRAMVDHLENATASARKVLEAAGPISALE